MTAGVDHQDMLGDVRGESASPPDRSRNGRLVGERPGEIDTLDFRAAGRGSA